MCWVCWGLPAGRKHVLSCAQDNPDAHVQMAPAAAPVGSHSRDDSQIPRALSCQWVARGSGMSAKTMGDGTRISLAQMVGLLQDADGDEAHEFFVEDPKPLGRGSREKESKRRERGESEESARRVRGESELAPLSLPALFFFLAILLAPKDRSDAARCDEGQGAFSLSFSLFLSLSLSFSLFLSLPLSSPLFLSLPSSCLFSCLFLCLFLSLSLSLSVSFFSRALWLKCLRCLS